MLVRLGTYCREKWCEKGLPLKVRKFQHCLSQTELDPNCLSCLPRPEMKSWPLGIMRGHLGRSSLGSDFALCLVSEAEDFRERHLVPLSQGFLSHDLCFTHCEFIVRDFRTCSLFFCLNEILKALPKFILPSRERGKEGRGIRRCYPYTFHPACVPDFYLYNLTFSS